MREYFFVLIGVCLICGAGSMLFFDNRGALSGKVNLVSALCVISVVISPVFSLISEVKNGELDRFLIGENHYDAYVFEEIYQENLAKESACEIEKRLTEMVCENFNISPQSLSLRLDVVHSEDIIEIEGVSVYLSGGAILKNPRDIIEYVGEFIDCECKVFYGGEDYE